MGGLSFSDRAARSMWRIVPKRVVSGAIGWGVSLGIPAPLRTVMLTRFAGIYGIDVSEAEKPLSEYAGFDEFFTRKLRPGARPIDDAPGRVVSPADGTIVESGLATAGKLLQAKGNHFDLASLLDDAQSAARLEGGAYVITYLSPKDYHRVHSPVGGRVLGWRHVPGTLFSVGAASIRREPGLFVRNERFITLIEMQGGGLVAVVMVAAVGVGHVTVSYDPEVATHRPEFFRAALRHRQYDEPKPIRRGEELGIFHLGSTTIVVFERGRVELDALAGGASVKMGVGIGRVAETTGNSQG
jgi:phosphatidylserine decarboxylase